jgi:hypothetical protein
MAFRNVLLATVAACLLAACAQKTPPPQVQAPTRPEPGSKIVAPAEEVFAALSCADKPLPLLVVESDTLTPNPAAPGTELQHRLVYAFCPKPGDKPETGALTRSLSLKGKTVFSDVTAGVTVLPGRVAVDAYLTVPAGAQPGTYTYTVEYLSDAEAKKRKAARVISFTDTLELVLKAKE